MFMRWPEADVQNVRSKAKVLLLGFSIVGGGSVVKMCHIS